MYTVFPRIVSSETIFFWKCKMWKWRFGKSRWRASVSKIEFTIFYKRASLFTNWQKFTNRQVSPLDSMDYGSKGPLILKGHFVVFNSLKNRTKNFCPSRLGQKFEFSSSFFLENWRHQRDISKLTDIYLLCLAWSKHFTS